MRQVPSTFTRRRVGATAVEGAPYKSGDVLAARYEIKDVRGAGPLGFVFRAQDRELELEVALKVISRKLVQTDEEREHFSRTIRTGRRLSHQNLARVNEDGVADGQPFYTSQYLEGLTLRKILEHRASKNQLFSLQEVEPILTQIGIALQAAHRLGPHSDIKPENVIVLPDLLKVTDFGMGLALPRASFVQALQGRKADRYLAPEWYREGKPVDARSDIYSLGVLLGEMLAYMTPDGSIPELSRLRPDLPAGVEAVYRKALSDDPAQRFQTPAEMIIELSALIGGKAPAPPSTRSRAQQRAVQPAPPLPPPRQGLSKLAEEMPPVPERYMPNGSPPSPAARGYSKTMPKGTGVVGGAAASPYPPDGPTLPPTGAGSDQSLDETQPFDASKLPPEITGLLSDQTQPFDSSMLAALPPHSELAKHLRAGAGPSPAAAVPAPPSVVPSVEVTPAVPTPSEVAGLAARRTLPIDEAPPPSPPRANGDLAGLMSTEDGVAPPPQYRAAGDAASTMAMDEAMIDEVLNPRPLFGAVAPPGVTSRSQATLWLVLLTAGGLVIGTLGGYLLLQRLRNRPPEVVQPVPGGASPVGVTGTASGGPDGGAGIPVAAAPPAGKCPPGMVLIPKGPFKMGTAKDDPMMGFDERTLAAVEVDAFCVDQLEYPNRPGEQPMVNVSWNDARRLCESKGKRLCTEQEWEKACKGPSGFRFPYGDAFDPNACNTETKAGEDREIAGGGAFPLCVSAFGVRDLSGNVAEWTSTPFAGHTDKTQKGGSFDRPDYAARCSARRSGPPSAKAPEVGFRCCAEVK
jgi:serine/threonine protein kinase/formylglycine-generating enzyme required for sulfatase activity